MSIMGQVAASTMDEAETLRLGVIKIKGALWGVYQLRFHSEANCILSTACCSKSDLEDLSHRLNHLLCPGLRSQSGGQGPENICVLTSFLDKRGEKGGTSRSGSVLVSLQILRGWSRERPIVIWPIKTSLTLPSLAIVSLRLDVVAVIKVVLLIPSRI